MTKLYCVKDELTKYAGALVEANSDGEIIANFRKMLSVLQADTSNPQNSVVRDMVKTSNLYCLGTFDPDSMTITAHAPEMVCTLSSIPVEVIADEKTKPDSERS